MTDGETVETVSDFIFGGSKITADGTAAMKLKDACSLEEKLSHKKKRKRKLDANIKRRLLLGRKVMTNLDSISKSRDITLPTKVHLVKATVFSSGHVWM